MKDILSPQFYISTVISSFVASVAAVLIIVHTMFPVTVEVDLGRDCDQIGEVAGKVMMARQDGDGLWEALRGFYDPTLASEMVRLAYKIPKYHAEELRRETAELYGNTWKRYCSEFM
jgi:hypothetical protein